MGKNMGILILRREQAMREPSLLPNQYRHHSHGTFLFAASLTYRGWLPN